MKVLRTITTCSAFTLECRYDNSNIELSGNVYCPTSRCLRKFCVHKKTLQSLGRSGYQCPQCTSTYQERKVHFEEQAKGFFWKCDQGLYVFDEIQKAFQDIIESVPDPGRYWSEQKCVHTWEKNDENCCHFLQCKVCCHIFNNHFEDQKLGCLALIAHIALSKKPLVTPKLKNHLRFEVSLPPITINTIEPLSKK